MKDLSLLFPNALLQIIFLRRCQNCPLFSQHHIFWCVSLNNCGVSSFINSYPKFDTWQHISLLLCIVFVKRLTLIECCTKNHLLLPFVFLCAIFVFPRTIHVFPSAILVFPRAANFAAILLQPQPPLTSCANLVHSTHDEDN